MVNSRFQINISQLFLALGIATLLGACGNAPETTAEVTETSELAQTSSTELPPGFTDEPPPPPTSDTLVLSGGVLLTETPITDAVIVLTDGVILSWGRRGEVDLPNDSIGVDMRGKWIRAVSTLTSGATADLLIFDQYPTDASIAPVGTVKSTEITMPESGS